MADLLNISALSLTNISEDQSDQFNLECVEIVTWFWLLGIRTISDSPKLVENTHHLNYFHTQLLILTFTLLNWMLEILHLSVKIICLLVRLMLLG